VADGARVCGDGAVPAGSRRVAGREVDASAGAGAAEASG
jgi:hypothetical protein